MNVFRIAVPVALAVATQLAHSQAVLEEVVVTAQKREEGLQDVPIAVQAFTSESLDRLTAQDIGDLDAFTPNVEIPRSSNQPSYKIRGIGTSDFGVGADPAVGVYLDGVYIGRSGGSKVAFNDIARIEILNGPQGTLFGRNAAAGAIQYVTNKPIDETEGWVQATLGNYNRVQVEGVYNLPLTDQLYWRTGVLANTRDGYVTNIVTGDDHQYQKNWAITSALRWLPSDNLDILWRVEYDKIDQDSKAVTSALYGPRDNAGADFRETATNRRLDETRELFGTSLHLTYELSAATFTSITSYRTYESENPENQDGWIDPTFEFDDNNIEDNEQWSQEFRFAGEWGQKLQWTVGANYHEETAKQTSAISLDPSAADRLIIEREVGVPYDTFPPGTGYDLAFSVFPHLPRIYTSGAEALAVADRYRENINVQGDYTSWAVFADFTYDVTEKLSLTAGVRYTEDEKDFSRFVPVNDFGVHFAFTPTLFDDAGNYLPVGGTIPGSYDQSESWNETTPRFVVDYALTEDVLLYASWALGYKAGGFNSADDSNVSPAFDPAEVENLEFGIKSTWLDNTLRVNATYFDFDYENLQDLTFIPASCLPESDFDSNQFETSDVEGQGVELAVNWVPVNGLELWGNLGTLDAKYTDRVRRREVDGVCDPVDETGNKLTGSPEISYALGATYTYAMNAGSEVSAAISWGWQEGETDRLSCKYIEDLGTGTSAYYELDTVDGDLTISQDSAVAPRGDDLPFDSCPDLKDKEQLNLRLAYLSPNGNWEVAGWMTNATDWGPDTEAGGSGAAIASPITDGAPSYDRREPPRMYGMEFKYMF
ncbi:TonB-dependent receptor [Halieaceae bacterium IMCC14734]|uniref:TonB-dependent receptor n=1 Tax=Candidatus Litorirhabdus singularis TaxID=2518993 RepID=A0ABT3TJU1_9GAMM|nr:TonB-dependent receptor [Candidatus Litorirhabdus singularis]MCX2982585.1 TonB-dependent receptor [Candidatus Litorirhabdus singularis]